MEENERLREALQPFANCVEQIKATEDDEEWAKFRLLIKDYRRAAKAVGLTLPGLKRCSTCGGEFDEGEWDASSECPECETPKTRAALSPKSEKQECPEADELERRAREIEGDSDNPLRVAAANRLYAEASALRSEKQLSALRKWRGA
jgi:predicted Zn-ribbon and HTH transcriptional regulator